MRSCIILGCGRSGTSLTAGLLQRAGYYVGNNLWPADDNNPLGYFESPVVNSLNELILHKCKGKYNRQYLDRWIEVYALNLKLPRARNFENMESCIRDLVKRFPFAYKDPRFSYTLPVWRPYLPDTVVFVCVFRHPGAFIGSILSLTKKYDAISLEGCAALYKAMYSHILERHLPAGGTWVFVNYEDLIAKKLDSLEAALEVKLDAGFADARLNHSGSMNGLASAELVSIYDRLVKLSDSGT